MPHAEVLIVTDGDDASAVGGEGERESMSLLGISKVRMMEKSLATL